MFTKWKLKKEPYHYDFPTSGFEVIDKIRAELEDQAEWDYAKNDDLSNAYCLERAALYGVLAPYNEEQQALTRFLVSRRAGPMISTYAWGIYTTLRPSNLTKPD